MKEEIDFVKHYLTETLLLLWLEKTKGYQKDNTYFQSQLNLSVF